METTRIEGCRRRPPRPKSRVRLAAGRLRQMDLGDILRYGGRRYYLRGLDPIGARPRYVYLEDVRTRESMSVEFEGVAMVEQAPSGRLRLAREDTDDRSTRGDAGKLKR